MTRNRRHKKAVRSHADATGRSYLDAARSLSIETAVRTPLAAQLRDDLVTELEAAGWPVEIEHVPQGAALRLYAGPAHVQVSRADHQALALSGDEHPDDPDVFDLAAPLQISLWAPLVTEFDERLQRVIGVDGHQIAAEQSVGEIIAEINAMVNAARRRDVNDASLGTECGICGDPHPGPGLLEPSSMEVPVCSCCAFDGDLLGAIPAQLALQLDLAVTQTLALPAGWAGAQALLSCLGGDGFGDQLRAVWRRNGVLYEPMQWWWDATRAWIWLPAAERRPAALTDLGCGASLACLVAAIDRAHPDMRKLVQRRRERDIADYLTETYGEDVLDEELGYDVEKAGARQQMQTPEGLLERLWPAAVAYAVGMLTQQADRPGHRSPWHVLESFELGDWVSLLAPDLDTYHVETLLHDAIIGIRDVLAASGPA